jgi:hypothetical protein
MRPKLAFAMAADKTKFVFDAAALGRVPQAPDLGELERLFAREGVDVSAILVPERF